MSSLRKGLYCADKANIPELYGQFQMHLLGLDSKMAREKHMHSTLNSGLGLLQSANFKLAHFSSNTFPINPSLVVGGPI